MKNKASLIVLIFSVLAAFFLISAKSTGGDDDYLVYTVNPQTQHIKLFWKNDRGVYFQTLQNLKSWVERGTTKLLFAMNGGMYQLNHEPVGLYIENKKVLSPLDTSSGMGNFYLKPNGVFYITDSNTAAICKTENFVNNGQVKYATQSGPMLVIDGKIHPSFKNGSTNVNVRNGVGVLPDGRVAFVMAKNPINLYDFALYFKTLGCKNALYLDGFISRTYLPEKNSLQTDGDFGVIIGITSAD